MKYFIFILLILIIIFMYFIMKKTYNNKNRILRTSSQFNNIRNEYRNSISKTKHLNVKFVQPSITTAIANNKSTIF